MLANGLDVLKKAHKENYAVGAFNVNNMELCQAIVSAAETQKAPVFIQTSEGALDYANIDELHNIMQFAARRSSVPIVVHLDHGKELTVVKKCIDIGYTSVMFDGSHLSFEDNIKQTKQVCKWAHAKGIPVEAELGTIGGTEDKVTARKIIMTEPSEAKDFVERSTCDSLAIAIGTSHGANKFMQADAKLDIARLKEIRKIVDIPLVLHGGSSVPQDAVAKATKYGAKFDQFYGVPEDQITESVQNGINKINTDTDIRLEFTAAIRQVMVEKPWEFDPRKFLAPARVSIQQRIEHRIRVFGSAGKA